MSIFKKMREGERKEIRKEIKKLNCCNPATECNCYKYILLHIFFVNIYLLNKLGYFCTTLCICHNITCFHAGKILTYIGYKSSCCINVQAHTLFNLFTWAF